jgi:hypothetical protein
MVIIVLIYMKNRVEYPHMVHMVEKVLPLV